jgi:hypothetical protein
MSLRPAFAMLLGIACSLGAHSPQPAGKSTPAPSQSQGSTNPPQSEAPPPDEKKWSFTASALAYFVPDDREYVQPTFTADRGWLHLEGRYNYEDLNTGSAWFGYNFSTGEKVTLEVTPMVGAVFGNTNGIAPGYKATLGWRKLSLYTEGAVLFDSSETSDSFFYTWSELTYAPVDWLRFGAVIQRTKLYKTEFDVQRGLLAGVSYKSLDFTSYVFNVEAKPMVVLGVAFNF